MKIGLPNCNDPAYSAAESESTGPISSIMILPRICSKLRHLRKIKAAVAKPEIKIQNRESCVGARGETRKSRIQNHEAPGKDFRLNRESSEFRIQNRQCKQGRSARIQSSESRRRLARVCRRAGQNPEFRISGTWLTREWSRRVQSSKSRLDFGGEEVYVVSPEFAGPRGLEKSSRIC